MEEIDKTECYKDNKKEFRLLDVKKFFMDWDDIILAKETEETLKQIVKELEAEKVLATYGLKPKQKILFYGHPGTGKTLAAKVVSSVVGYPLVYVRFDSIISSCLEKTLLNLRKIFDFIEKGTGAVFFDKFDIIEKQIMNNFMLILEDYKGDSIIMTSTNHPHLLDIGVWSRFDEVVYFDLPDKERREKIFEKYLRVLKKSKNFSLNGLPEETEGFSGADIKQTCINALKIAILSERDFIDVNDVKRAILTQKERIKIIGGNKN